MKILVVGIVILFVLSGTGQSFAQVQSSFFTNAVNLSNTLSDSQSPELVSSHDGLFVVWAETDSGRSNIFFSKSTNGGVTFDAPINLSSSYPGQSSSPTIVQKDKNVYVTWQSSTSGNSTVLFTKSSDGGTSFVKPVRISETSKNSAFPQIAISENHIYSSWIEKSNNASTNIILTKSDDGGNSFQNPLYITHITGNVGIPKLFADGNQVYLIWEDNSKGNFEIFLSKSGDYGTSFDTPLDVSNTIGQSGTPQLEISKNNLYAIWMDNTSGNYDILFAKSDDGGKSFGKSINLSNLHGDSGYPNFSVSGNNVYVTWTQTVSNQNYDIFFAKSNDSGETFGKPINLSNNPGGSGWPQIVSNENIYVSWVDDSPGKFDVFITKSTNGGISFENPTNISNSKNDSYDDKLVTLDNTVYTIWQEGKQGNHTIVFSKSTEQTNQIPSQQGTTNAGDTAHFTNPNLDNSVISFIIIGTLVIVVIAVIILFIIKRKGGQSKQIPSSDSKTS